MASYSDWLNQQIQNKKVENTPSNAVSFKDYLSQNAIDPTSQYNTQVASANQTYQRSLATYGQNAEALAQNGLTNSGYASYLSGNAYATRANTVNQAQQQASDTLNTASQGYASYLENLKTQNTQNEANAYSALSEAVSNGQSLNSAIASLNGLYDQSFIDSAIARYKNATYEQMGDSLNTASKFGTNATEIDNQVALGVLTQEQADELKAKNSARNASLLQNAFNGDISGIGDYINSLAKTKKDGTVKKEGTEVWKEMSDDEKSAQIQEWYDNAYDNGYISEADYNKVFYDMLDSYYAEDFKSQKDYVDAVRQYKDDGRISQEQYNTLIDRAINNTIAKNGVEVGKITPVDQGGGVGTFSISITNSKGKTSNNRIYVDGEYTPTKENIVLSNNGVEIGNDNGQLYVRYKGKTYKTSTKDDEVLYALGLKKVTD